MNAVLFTEWGLGIGDWENQEEILPCLRIPASPFPALMISLSPTQYEGADNS